MDFQHRLLRTDAKTHVTLPMIEHILNAARMDSSTPKYVQFSSHDDQIANLWEFLGRNASEWPMVPYAAQTTFALLIDDLCIEQRLYYARNILTPGQYFDYEHGFTDSLFTEAQMEQLHACLAVEVKADGKLVDLGIGRRDVPLPFALFRSYMDGRSFEGRGFDK